ncbi:ArsR/SmtB family transcription factor [Fuchsiella alkaliacetigena]|uniref:ArsR/SmtB family transcription factor n=1 Tax=Fuchsiella alkaliacetigena TaxID=957042 RepID=UPI00200B9CA6|nr:metalloregulator ArsR/SmtB family transcription factor [Fuchsiella alkaliacetigena]MCK8825578.1 metalloregulator ArsR/SmtB family transcription factor [Fuchsiella alkaliacetigena]
MENIDEVIDFFKLVADKTRLNIIVLLSKGELCVCEIEEELDISQPRVSHHLKVLKEEGLVNSAREGKWIYYSLNEKIFELFDSVKQEFSEMRKELAQSSPSNKCRDEEAVQVNSK